MLLDALFLFALAIEAFLFLGKDYVLDTHRRVALESSIRQGHDDLKESNKRMAARRQELLAAIDDAERRRSDIQKADRAFAESQKVLPTLIHVFGSPAAGTRFRATVAKELPATPERSQKLIWACKNFVDVYAPDVETARALLSSQFQERHGYIVSEPVAADSAAPSPPREAAA